MLSVYFVDDDSLIIEELKIVIDWKKYGYEIIGSSTNPFVAEKEIEKLNPTLVIVDVQMRGLSGLELANNLSKLVSSKFIFLSNYDKFDYAIEAMKIGAIRYLKKPIRESSLIEVIELIKRNEINDFNSKVFSLTSEGLSKETIKYLDNCFANNKVFPLHKSFRLICTNGNIKNSNFLSLLLEKSNYYQIIYSDDDLTTIIVFDLDYKAFKENLIIEGYSLAISQNLSEYENIYNLLKRVRVASKVKFLNLNNKFIEVKQDDSSETLKKQIESCVNLYDLQQAIISLKDNILKEDVRICDIQKLYITCVYGLYKFRALDSIEELLSISVVNFYDNIDAMIEELLLYFNTRIDSNDISNKVIIDEIKNHLLEHIDEKISLSYYAKKYSYSNSNLSLIFKKIVGMSFVEYTTMIKIDMAKFLIVNNPNKSFKEIASSVGYDDYYHFSKMFKKTCLYTPNGFREKFGKK